MFFRKHHRTYEARLATPGDVVAIQQLMASTWRVFLRMPPNEALRRVPSDLAWVASEGDRIGGFLLAEIRTRAIAFITAAAARGDWPGTSYLDTFLPLAESTLRAKGVTGLVQIGHAPWLTSILSRRGFASRDWVVTYEWQYQPVTVSGNPSVRVRSAHLRDLPTLLSLDERIFDPIWHKPAGNFEEALAQAYVFTVAEKEGQIVGYLWCDRHERHGHITRLAVQPGWEGKGVGTRLLTEALTVMGKAGIGWITLNTQESNQRSRMLYEHHGFRLLDDRVDVLWKEL
jgi:ribosomal-protein-alanine N-acetyltransferase